MFRIGTVNIDTSHAPAFADLFAKGDTARYTCVYNDAFRTDDEVNAFMQKFSLEKRYYSLDEMAQNVDLAFIQGCDWDRHAELAKPFIAAGVPVFIDKPLVGNLADIEFFEEAAAKGAKIIGTSALRYTFEHQEFFAVEQAARGEVFNVTATVGVDEFNYAIHAVESIFGFFGDIRFDSVKWLGTNTMSEVPCDTYMVKFENGATATYHICLKGWQPSCVVVMTTKTSFAYKIDTSKVYEAMLIEVSKYLRGEPNLLVSVGEMTESIRVMLAGRKSKLNNGAEIKRGDLSVSDGGFDGAKFEIGYAAEQRAVKK